MAEILHFEKMDDNIHHEFAALLETLKTSRMITSCEMVDNQLRQVEHPAYQLLIANALWGQEGYPWQQDFLDLTTDCYGSGLHEVDFAGQTEAARNTINTWVEEQTRDRIKELIGPGVLTLLTRLVLTNAIYFKANWEKSFSDHLTQNKLFHISTSQPIQTPMMSRTETFRYMETDTFQALEMAYKAGELSMVVFLPKKTDGLADFENELTPEFLSVWLGKLEHETVDVSFPKFEFTRSFSLVRVLKALGMTDAFSPSVADFSGMTTVEDVYVSDIIHKAFVAVDEQGTEAAAATAVVIAAKSMRHPRSEPIIFRADHPFVFIIRHQSSGSILFMGRVVNPQMG